MSPPNRNRDLSTRRPKKTSISIGMKLEILRQVEDMQKGGSSLRNAARAFNIQGNQIRRCWRKQFDTGNAGVLRRNMKARSFCTGRSLLEPFEGDEILQWLFSLQEQGTPVSIGMVVLKARKVVGSSFRSKLERAQYMICYRFLASHKYGIRIGTHVSQRSPSSEVCQEAKDYVSGLQSTTMQESCRDPRFILNMDQTPVFFTMTPNTTIDKKGKKTVNIRSSTTTTSRISVALTVTASGELLHPFLVFKGKPNGCIDKKELITFPPEGEYTVQEKAWMDSVVMLRWIDTVLKPFDTETVVPEGIRPLLLAGFIQVSYDGVGCVCN
jgi:DDE superfamily endonuclease